MDRQTDGEMLDHLVTCCGVDAGGHPMPAVPDTATIVHGVWHANDGTDGHGQTNRRRDARPFHRPCCAYYASSVSYCNTTKIINVSTVELLMILVVL